MGACPKRLYCLPVAANVWSWQPPYRSVFNLPMASPTWLWVGLWYNLVAIWDLTYVTVGVPALVAFNVDRDDRSLAMYILELVSSLLYLANTFIGFHVGYVVQYGTRKGVILDGKWVAWRYTRSLELYLTLIPALELILLIESGRQRLHYVLLFRIIYVARLLSRIAFKGSYVIYFANWSLGLRAYTFIFNMLMVALLTVHFWACAFILAAHVPKDQSDSWLVQFGAEIEVNNEGAVISPWWKSYINSVFLVVTTMTTVGYGDLKPNTPAEVLLDIPLQLTGLVFWSIVVGYIKSSLLDNSTGSRRLQYYTQHVQPVEGYLRRQRIDGSVVSPIRDWYFSVWARAQAQKGQDLLNELYPALRTEVVSHLSKRFMERMDLFRYLPSATLHELAPLLQSNNYSEGTRVAQEGTPVRCIVLLEQGSLVGSSVQEVGQVGPGGARVQRTWLERSFDGPSAVNWAAILTGEAWGDEGLGTWACSLQAASYCKAWDLPLGSLELLIRSKRKVRYDLLRALRQQLRAILEDPDPNHDLLSRSIYPVSAQMEVTKLRLALQDVETKLRPSRHLQLIIQSPQFKALQRTMQQDRLQASNSAPFNRRLPSSGSLNSGNWRRRIAALLPRGSAPPTAIAGQPTPSHELYMTHDERPVFSEVSAVSFALPTISSSKEPATADKVAQGELSPSSAKTTSPKDTHANPFQFGTPPVTIPPVVTGASSSAVLQAHPGGYRQQSDWALRQWRKPSAWDDDEAEDMEAAAELQRQLAQADAHRLAREKGIFVGSRKWPDLRVEAATQDERGGVQQLERSTSQRVPLGLEGLASPTRQTSRLMSFKSGPMPPRLRAGTSGLGRVADVFIPESQRLLDGEGGDGK